MFNLEREIGEWRRRMAKAGIKPGPRLDELEGHLREESDTLKKGGTPEDRAFGLAVEKMGSAQALTNEFKKVGRISRPFLAWCAALAVAAGVMGWKCADGMARNLSPLLVGNIFSYTLAYLAAFAAGGMAIYGLRRNCGAQIRFEVRLLQGLAAALVAAGFISGSVWTVGHDGQFWIGNARQIAGTVGAGWLVLSVLALGRKRVSDAMAMRGAVVGNIVVASAWFIAVARHPGAGGIEVMAAFVAAHAFSLVGRPQEKRIVD